MGNHLLTIMVLQSHLRRGIWTALPLTATVCQAMPDWQSHPKRTPYALGTNAMLARSERSPRVDSHSLHWAEVCY